MALFKLNEQDWEYLTTRVVGYFERFPAEKRNYTAHRAGVGFKNSVDVSREARLIESGWFVGPFECVTGKLGGKCFLSEEAFNIFSDAADEELAENEVFAENPEMGAW